MSTQQPHSHSHSHSHGGDDGDHSHSHSHDLPPAVQSSLYSQIDFDGIVTLNEREPGSGPDIFTGQCTLHSLLLHAPPTSTSPQTIHLPRNRPDLDFATAVDLAPTQTLNLPPPTSASSSTILELLRDERGWDGAPFFISSCLVGHNRYAEAEA
ncbi:hypothetical protein EPUS_01404 [Endocarpon pusillum Z07020]|uniref:PITH domain-containing protein n=1 Tax=Endocarpon pusillum (strain Z07020 / HMAS-L-300199) TaxID=1263415 RepID=U1GVI8_ENDPU|nr:uncharacterized protein EPUS_01404 [Endocarpon pusillum Z07020]ERF76071.1 hypothetical protein EPUS_01404 [Endocarpon pusillum Z07020]